MIYSRSIRYTGEDTDLRVPANCDHTDSLVPESQHRTLGLKFTTIYKRVVLSINDGRKHNPVQKFSARTVMTPRGPALCLEWSSFPCGRSLLLLERAAR